MALTLRLPEDIQQRAQRVADDMGLTLSAYIRLAISEYSRWKDKAIWDEQVRDIERLNLRERSPVAKATTTRSRRPAQSLNSPCACGSGLKYKRCCGAVLA